jgi:ribosomal protein RSM22 (predicted rRNA methylase)
LAAIEDELGERAAAELKAPATDLSETYRSGRAPARELGPVAAHAYLAARAPATFASTARVLAELAGVAPGFAPESLLDLGAGPGTATWAAVDAFASIRRAVLVERDQEMAAIGARMAERGGLGLEQLSWTSGDAAFGELPASDLVVAAYLLGELGRERQEAALGLWWAVTRGQLVLVEPGTPAGFGRLRAARSLLVSWGAHVSAPCPHDGACPMTGADWCHFSVRLARSALQRELKGAQLGYEDEKYSYLVVSSRSPRWKGARLVRSPRPRKGHVRLVLCEAGGLSDRVVSRRDGELYRRARSARWGDRLEIDRDI